MSETLFIADVHLEPKHPTTVALFLKFLAHRAIQAEALYILGDLFEVWVGDDDQTPIYQTVMAALKQLTKTTQLPVFIMHGNRDFLLGEKFMAATGSQWLPDPSVITLYGTPTLIMHGDSLCTLDVKYQNFRTQVRSSQWQQQFLAQPLVQRHQLAQQAREHSQTYTQQTLPTMLDATPVAITSALQQHGVSRLIHGHTHHPGDYPLTLNDGSPAYRRVVGQWQEDSAIILSCTPDSCQLLTWS